MRILVAAVVLSLCLLGVTAYAAEYTGFISDVHCGAAHMDGSQKSIDCVKSCVKGGQAPIFVTMDKKILKIADASKVQNFLGLKVMATGTLAGDTLTIDTVKAAK